jgi:hypothetical protein
MSTPSPEELRSAAKKLVTAGTISYEDWPFYQWYDAAWELLSQEQVDAMCLAVLAAEKVRDKSKGGRPKLKESEKLKCISTLVSPARYAELHAEATITGVSISQLVRPLVDPQHESIKQRLARLRGRGLSVAERQKQREVAGMAGNLNQLAKLAHTAGLLAVETELRKLSADIRALLTY